MYLLKLVRLPNLLIVALTQFLLQWVVRDSISHEGTQNTVHLVLNNLQFSIFVLATVCVTAAGYIINDIYDIEIDAHNKPIEKQIVGRKISKRNAYILYIFLAVTGGLLSLEVANAIHHLEQLWLYPVFVLGLWLYAAYLKKTFLLGNLFVAFFCAAVAWIIFYAQNLNYEADSFSSLLLFLKTYFIFIGYSALAFLTTLLREIIKDKEDAKGDAQFGARTLPIVVEVKFVKIICYFIALTVIGLIIFMGSFFENSTLKFLIWQSINLFVLYLGYLVYKAQTKSDWHKAATFAKIMMLVGLVFVVLLL